MSGKDGYLQFVREEGGVRVWGSAPSKVHMTWELVDMADPKLLVFEGSKVTVIGDLVYEIVGVDMKHHCINLELVEDNRKENYLMRCRSEDGFNTYGQEKCWHCASYFPEAWIYDHAAKCPSNPENQVNDDE